MAASTLFVFADPVISGSSISSLLQELGVDIRTTDFTFHSPSTIPSTSLHKYANAVVLFSAADDFDGGFLGRLTTALQPGALVTVCSVQETSTSDLTHKLVLNGLVEVSADSAASTSGCKTVVKGKTPGWGLGAKTLLGKKKQPAAAPAPAAAQKWTLAADDEEELIDDDELLTEEDLKKPAPVSADDCEVGAGRKACKNCSCGRAEAEEAAVKLTPDMMENATSACGNCFLGDAFRCGSCPYRGLPAFEKGQKIELPSSFLTADV